MRHIRKQIQKNLSVREAKKIDTPKPNLVKSVVRTVINTESKPLMPNPDTPTVYILTRTSNRPHGFKRCHESIKRQTYKNIRHIVSIDNINDKSYVEQYDVDYIFIDKTQIESQPDIPNPNTGKRFIFNLYFNILMAKATDGWIIFLDDDDYLIDSDVISKTVASIKSNEDMLIWQMKYPNGSILPTSNEMNTKPRLGRIGSPCIMVHSSIANQIKWDGWKCGDYRFISKVWDLTKNKVWIKQPMIQLGDIGMGLRKDLGDKSNDVVKPVVVPNVNRILNNHQPDSPKKILDAFKSKFIKVENTNNINKLSNTSNTTTNINNLNNENYYNDIIVPTRIFDGEVVLIVMSNYNRGDNILDSIKSVLNQTYKNVLLHIIDDNSTDDSVSIIFNYLKSINVDNVKFTLSMNNVGTYTNRNQALYTNKFDWWTICDSDDIILPNHVENTITQLKKHNKSFGVPLYQRVYKNSGKKIQPKHGEGIFFYHKKIYNIIGYYDYNKFGADTDYLWRVKQYFGDEFKINDCTYIAYAYGDNLTIKHKKNERLKYVAKIKNELKNGLINRPIILSLHQKYNSIDNLKKSEDNSNFEPLTNNNIFSVDYTYSYLYDKLKNNINFTYLRFGDNDFMHIFKQNVGRELGHNKTVYNDNLHNFLLDSIKCNGDGYIKTYNFAGYSVTHKNFKKQKIFPLRNDILNYIKKYDKSNCYHSVLFFYIIMSYYPKYVEGIFSFIRNEKNTLYVGSVQPQYAKKVLGDFKYHIETAKYNSTANISKYITQIDNLISKQNIKYIILACGQLSRVLGGYIYKNYGNKFTILDIGGIIETFDPKTTKSSVVNNKTIYQKNMSFNLNKNITPNISYEIQPKIDKQPLGVIMCTWKRFERLNLTLSMLNEQTNKDFVFYIWNNNIELKNKIENLILNYKDINIKVYHSDINIGGLGRFKVATQNVDNHKMFLFFDDDQEFKSDYIEKFTNLFKSKTLTSWYAFKIIKDYHVRTRVKTLTNVDYCGTGGLLADAELFKDNDILNIPIKYQFIEDLWLSYYAKYIHIYQLRGCDIWMQINVDNKDQYTTNRNLRDLKTEFYNFLEKKYNKK